MRGASPLTIQTLWIVWLFRIPLSSADVQWSVRVEPLSRVSAGANNEIVVKRENLCQISVVFLYILVVFLYIERFLFLTKVWDKQDAIRGFIMEIPNCRIISVAIGLILNAREIKEKFFVWEAFSEHPPYLTGILDATKRRLKWTARSILRTIR